MSKCQLEPNNFTPCQAMKIAMQAKNLYVRQVINFRTLEERVAGVAFRYGKKTEAIYFNCCPFCTTMIDSQHEPPKVAEEGNHHD